MTDDRQCGQALVEALLVLAVLASLWLGVAWLGRLQDVALQLSNASRHAAFAHAHQGLSASDLDRWVDTLWDRARPRWLTRQGDPLLLADQAGSSLQHERVATPWREPGTPQAGRLRGELGLGDGQLWRLDLQVTTRGTAAPRDGLRDFDQQALSLQRHTAILKGAGAARDDGAVQQTLGASATAWGDLAARTRGAGERVARALQAVDGAWPRRAPDWDWLNPWVSSIPRHYLGRGAP